MIAVSRPSRARGLKLLDVVIDRAVVSSRPSRARGLKPLTPVQSYRDPFVAPLAGAWIETGNFKERLISSWSRPSRARGLKPVVAVIKT